jgi:hypothetical protein
LKSIFSSSTLFKSLSVGAAATSPKDHGALGAIAHDDIQNAIAATPARVLMFTSKAPFP